MIAAAAGVSKQAISTRLSRGGAPDIPKRTRRPSASKTAFRCQECGKIIWHGLDFNKEKFCSTRCSGEARREISDDLILQAIELRKSNNSWAFVSKSLRFTPQGLQRRIWLYLHRNGLLTRAAVIGIWAPGARWRDRLPSWKWLERTTGIRPHG